MKSEPNEPPPDDMLRGGAPSMAAFYSEASRAPASPYMGQPMRQPEMAHAHPLATDPRLQASAMADPRLSMASDPRLSMQSAVYPESSHQRAAYMDNPVDYSNPRYGPSKSGSCCAICVGLCCCPCWEEEAVRCDEIWWNCLHNLCVCNCCSCRRPCCLWPPRCCFWLLFEM